MLDRVDVTFDEQRSVVSAGLLLVAPLAERLGSGLRQTTRWRWPAGARGHAFTPCQQRGLVPYAEATGHRPGGGGVSELGANALGEVLVPGRVPDCSLGLRLDPAGDAQAAGVLVVGPSVLLDPAVPQPDGTLVYELLTRSPGPHTTAAGVPAGLLCWARTPQWP